MLDAPRGVWYLIARTATAPVRKDPPMLTFACCAFSVSAVLFGANALHTPATSARGAAWGASSALCAGIAAMLFLAIVC